jgi:predicted TIM-barrel fold metal-dependent hydrolase
VDARVRLPLDQRPAAAREYPPQHTAGYDAVLGLAETRGRPLADLLEDMDATGVACAVVHAEYEHGDFADDLNEAVAKVVSEHAGRFWGFGTVSLDGLRPMRAARQVTRVADLGLAGINIQPCFFDLAIDESRLYPVYAKASELDLVVAVHTGINYARAKAMDGEHPLRLDRVASHFPDLRLIACHGAWPWVTELVAVARRHPNVFIDFGGLAPKYVGQPGTGWEVLRRFMENLLTNRVLFATDWPVFSMQRALKEWHEMGLRPSTVDALTRTNILRLLKANTHG